MAEIIMDKKDQNIDAEAIDLEQLDNVNGGATADNRAFGLMFSFTTSDVEILKKNNIEAKPNKNYLIRDLNKLGIPGSSGDDIKRFLCQLGINEDTWLYLLK